MNTPGRRPRSWRAASAGATILALVAAGCSSSHRSGTTIFGAGSSTSTVAPSTTIPPTSTTVAPTTTTTTIRTTTTTTEAPTTTEEATTTTQAPGAEVPLRADGLGDVRFGAEPDAVLAYLTGELGKPTADTGWVGAGGVGCPGDDARIVFFDDLKVVFGDSSDVSKRRRHFFAYSFGPPAGAAPKPAGLETRLGVTIGTSVTDILDAYPEAELIVGDATTTPGAQLTDGLFVVLTDTARSGRVTAVLGGDDCSR